MATPVTAFSEQGMSNTLLLPNSSCRPTVVPKTPFGSGTPSPMTITLGSAAMASAVPTRMASAPVMILPLSGFIFRRG